MSVSYPLNNNPVPARGESTPGEVPIKAFRTTPMAPPPVNAILERLRSLYEDRLEWKRSITAAIMMFVLIGLSVAGKAPGTFVGMAVLVLCIVVIAATDAWAGLLLFLIYLSLEGMFKYTSFFSTAIYVIAPCLGIYIFVTWRLATRAREAMAQKKQQEQAETPVSQKSEKAIPLPQLANYVFGLVLLIVVQFFNPDAGGFVGAIASSIVWYLAPISLFFVAYYSVRNSKQLTGYMYVTIAIGFVTSAYAMVQYFLGEAWCQAHILGFDSINRLAWFNVSSKNIVESGVFRPPSTFAIAGGYTVAAVQGILAVIMVSQMDKMPTSRRVLVLAVGFVMAVAIAMSGGRSMVLILIMVVPIALFLSVRSFQDATRIYFLTFLMAGLTLGVFGVADLLSEGKIGRRLGFSVMNPLKSYQTSRAYHFTDLGKAIAIRPMGIGMQRGISGYKGGSRNGMRNELQPLANRETQWNATHADQGILGMVLVFAFFVAIIGKGYRYIRAITHPRLRLITVFLVSYIISVFIGTFGAASMQGNTFFWITCGLLLAVPRIYAAENKFVLTGKGIDNPLSITEKPTK